MRTVKFEGKKCSHNDRNGMNNINRLCICCSTVKIRKVQMQKKRIDKCQREIVAVVCFLISMNKFSKLCFTFV